MAGSQVEGDNTQSSNPLIEWLINTKLSDDKLIEVLHDEEIESVEDLIVFKDTLKDKRFTEIL